MSDSGEKAHAPSARRIAEARRAGRFAASPVLAAALALLVAIAALSQTAPTAIAGCILLLRRACERAAGTTGFRHVFVEAGTIGVRALALPLAVLFAASCVLGLVQSRGRLFPTARRRRPFSPVFNPSRAADVGKALVIFVVLAAVLGATAVALLPSLNGLYGGNAARILGAIGILGRHLWLRLSVALLVLGVADYLWRRHAHAKALRMSSHEFKRELRETEGDPLAKAERRRIHADAIAQSMDVARATLIVTGAGLAVAVRYDGTCAPHLVAKAQGHLLQQLLVTAHANQIAVVDGPDVVLSLFTADEGEEVPAALYDRLAELFVEAGLVRPPGDSPSAVIEQR